MKHMRLQYSISSINKLLQEFFPPAFETHVHPGFIFRSTSKSFHEGDHWYFAFGNDFWLQSKEQLNQIRPTECKKQ